MASQPKTTLYDRVALSCMAVVPGLIYGVLLWVAAFMITEQSHPAIVGLSIVVFSGLGFLYGDFVAEALLASLHFVWGLLNGFAGNGSFEKVHAPKGHLRAFLLVGFGTGIVLYIATCIV